ncbi:MAG TPA: cytochrome c biogenesis protein CcdA [Bacteroidales bacterium]|nr:cytochrome c biogenesis protein CcdA [Bacteroidales bacterium]HPF03574.1 cytochrome c biogenesis protein CcdA [Bacteroidales bacterium]HPJ59399.1 cytochrome c biogenesis protein CcdA [Bacteroidales bacterium]HPR12600.1 cytochrome c biogenesis protein CcdA [Bacteroidales bacterium]HRW86091.1 cytochrome c biogenesis protein CcdA [Bacteroidales bacterium]
MKQLINRSLVVGFSLFALSLGLTGQIFDPVTWSFTYENKGAGAYELVFTAEIEEGSYLYAMDVPEGGPIPTTFIFDTVPEFSFDGRVYEVTEPKEKFDEAFGFNIRTFSGKAEFRQKINSGSGSFSVKGSVNFMSCNSSTCSPPKDVEFDIVISDGTRTIPASGSDDSVSAGVEKGKGMLIFFLLSMLAGFAGILTPCVFPMIPMTVAFFSRDSGSRKSSVLNAIIFGISIILIYSSLGVLVSLTSAGAGFANALSTHWIPNIIFFTLFIIFAISFLGAFEIVLPNKWVTGADSKVDKGGILAAFFMGLTTVIVSFSCTGPIVGALLVEAAGGDVLRPTVGMFGFGLAFALPFTLFALFPSILNKIPKSGGWLNSVKVVLGFLMLAFSMKFLMTIDSVYNIGVITRDLYLTIWIVLFVILGLYLMGKIRFAHDRDLTHIGTFRFFLIIAVFTFALYLFTGLLGAPLTGLASMIPQQKSTAYVPQSAATQDIVVSSFPVSAISGSEALCSKPKHGDIFDLPYGLPGYFDYEQGLACAKEMGKPALIDFKGHACANCKLMEARVWSDPEVLQRLRDNFVIIALYVDDRTQLPEDEWFVSSIDGKTKKTIGKQNENLEISKFGTNALPLYVITDHEGNPVNKPMPSNLNVEEYKAWLDEGLELFRAGR